MKPDNLQDQPRHPQRCNGRPVSTGIVASSWGSPLAQLMDAIQVTVGGCIVVWGKYYTISWFNTSIYIYIILYNNIMYVNIIIIIIIFSIIVSIIVIM